MNEKPYLVLAYYHFVPLPDCHEEVLRHKAFFEHRDVTCRVYISEKGINGQMSASRDAAKEYIEWMHSRNQFSKVIFKIHEATVARENAEGELAQIRIQTTQKDAEVEAFQGLIGKLRSQVATLEQEKHEVNVKKLEAESQLIELRAELERLRAYPDDKTQQIEELQVRIFDLEAIGTQHNLDVAALNSNHEKALEAEKKRAADAITENAAKVEASFKQQLAQANQEKLNFVKKTLSLLLKNLQSSIQKFEKFPLLEEQMRTLNERFKELFKKFEALKNSSEEGVFEQLAQLQVEALTLIDEINEHLPQMMGREITNLNAGIESYQSEMRELQQRNAVLQRKLEQSTRSNSPSQLPGSVSPSQSAAAAAFSPTPSDVSDLSAASAVADSPNEDSAEDRGASPSNIIGRIPAKLQQSMEIAQEKSAGVYAAKNEATEALEAKRAAREAFAEAIKKYNEAKVTLKELEVSSGEAKRKVSRLQVTYNTAEAKYNANKDNAGLTQAKASAKKSLDEAKLALTAAKKEVSLQQKEVARLKEVVDAAREKTK